MANGKPTQAAAPKLLALGYRLSVGASSRRSVALNPGPRLTRSGDAKAGSLNPFLASAFTLTELLVVLGILAIVAALAVPALGPMFTSNQTASAISTLSSMLVNAQTIARAQDTAVALRIERAFKTNDSKLMVNIQGLTPYETGIKRADMLKRFIPPPVWLNHQQVRLLKLTGTAFEAPSGGFEPVALPEHVWLAPGEALTNAVAFPSLLENNLKYEPAEGVTYNRFENFMVVFNRFGELVRYPGENCYYLDRTQKFTENHDAYPSVEYPLGQDSSLSLIAYDRRRWENVNDDLARRDLLARTGVPIYINRFSGAILEEKR
ncbi:MAG TPA: prepilin-type N-terminal cleavage/methylation domain-containing protein [Phycisphaerae bacterium]|nr:prepilin-type N-terminal cleavage/methylation domain-containing protein [Phycisphaerae bacterium]HRR86028.1 prepilin-type N-terminal cleavage/methylation domain-containing protein [Phycisphaerae bacterium]